MSEVALNVICYSGTALTLLSYCFRTLKLRILLICGNVVNIVWSILAKQSPILISNILYLVINIFGLLKELRVNVTKKEFRKLNPYFKDGQYHCMEYSAPTEKELISLLKQNKKL
jgi:hypothetical protein